MINRYIQVDASFFFFCFFFFVVVFFFFFFVAFLFFIFWGKKYDEIGKNRGYLALGMGQNFGPTEQVKNAL